jgi:hypothetical protein
MNNLNAKKKIKWYLNHYFNTMNIIKIIIKMIMLILVLQIIISLIKIRHNKLIVNLRIMIAFN